jgi:hypothetical protein
MCVAGKPEGERPLERPRHRWDYNIKIGVKEIRWGMWTVVIWLKIVSNDVLMIVTVP